MPRFDGTGPWGLGPGTGWGLGPCGAGMAWRRGWGRGWGRRGFWNFQLSRKEEKELLEAELKNLEEEIKEIKNRLDQLKEKK